MPEIPFGPYTLVRRLAVGGMAEVHLARVLRPRTGGGTTERQVVVKQILPQLAEDPELLQLFRDEANIASKLTHPGIVQILDFGRHDGTFYLAMEYVDGLDLSELLRLTRAERSASGGGDRTDRVDASFIPVRYAIRIVANLASTVHYVHQATDSDGKSLDIVHRDISPQNVLLSRDGAVKLGDFGIARARIRAVQTATGVLRGKLAYVAPERFRDEPADRRVDVYALGVVLFESIAGRRPFEGDDPSFIKALLSEDPPRLSEIVRGIDPRIDAITARALARNPQDRIQSAGELAHQLDALGFGTNAEDLGGFISGMCQRRELIRERAQSSPDVTAPSRKVVVTETLPGGLVSSPDGPAVPVAASLAFMPSKTPATLSEEDGLRSRPLDPAEERALEPTVISPVPSRPAFEVRSIDPTVTGVLDGDRTLAIKTPRAMSATAEAGDPGEVPISALPTTSAPAPAPSKKKKRRWLPDAEGSTVLPPRAKKRVIAIVAVVSIAAWSAGALIASQMAPFRAEVSTQPVLQEPKPEKPADPSAPAPAPAPAQLPEVEIAAPEPAEPPAPAPAPEPAPKVEPPEAPEEPPVERPREKVRSRRTRDRRANAAASAKAAAAGRDKDQEVTYGELSIDTEPWSFVTIGGRSLGATPLAHVKLRAGEHQVELQNPEERIETSVRVTIRSEQRTAIRVRLRDGKLLRP